MKEENRNSARREMPNYSNNEEKRMKESEQYIAAISWKRKTQTKTTLQNSNSLVDIIKSTTTQLLFDR